MSTVNSNSSAPDQTVVAKDRLQAERINTDWARDGATLQPGSSDWARDGGTVTPNGLVNTPAATSKVRVAKRVVEEQEQVALPVAEAEPTPTVARGPGIQLAQLGTASSGFGFADEKLASTTGAELGEDRSSAGWGREAPTHEFALPTFNGMYGLAAGGLALATGGVGGSTAASSGVAGLPAALSSAVKVVVYDGLIKGASIYVDRNHDGKTDTSEKVGETDKDGVLHLSNLSSDDLKGVFLAVGGTNIDTGLPNSMQLQATSDGSGLVTLSPVSSLLAALQDTQGPNLSSADADKAVKQAFGFSDGFNLKTYDPSTASTQPDALKFQKAGAQIAALVSDVVLSSVAVPKLASYIVSNTAKVNLDSVDTLKAIYGTDTATVTAIQDVAVATSAIALASTAPQVVAAQYSSLAPVIVGLLNDTGSSSTDKLTTDPRLNVSGVTVGSHVQYSVDSGAHWVAAESFAPGAGPVTVSARLAYDNGFTTTASGPFTFTLSVATPVAPTLTLHHDSAPGAADAVNTDRVTNVATIDVGNVDANAVLEFSTDQIHWSSTQPQAVEGLNNLYAHQVYTLTGATSAVTPLTFTLDTHANVGTLGLAANVLGADVVNDTGITGDGITSNALPILSGQTEANASSVSVTLGGHSYSVAAADLSADGHWTLTVGGALADGTYIPTLTVVDAAGNISAPTAMAPITIDSVAPVAGTAALSASSDTGFASDDGLTSQTHPVIEGVTEAHANVAVDIDGSVYRTAADATGHWSVLVTTALTDGDYTPSITVTDAAGNVSDAVDGTPFSVYATPPQETIHAGLSQDDGVSETVPFQGTDVTLADDPGTFASDGITSNPIPLIVGEVDAPGTVVIMRLNGVTYTTVADDAGAWSIQIPEDNALDDGTYVPGLLYVDPAGNMTHLSGAPITIDTAAPDDVSGDLVHDDTNDTGIDNSDGITNNASPTLEGTTEAFAWVSVDIGGTVLDAVQADATGYWQVTADGLSDGTYTPIITVSDAAGNMTQSEGGVITIDTTAPEGTTGVFVHDADNDTGVSSTDGITNNNSPTLEGHAEANAHVTVDVGGTVFETDADANGYWTLTADGLDDGDYTPSIVVTDLAGNESDPVDGESFTVLTVGPDSGTAELVHDDVNDTGVDTEDNITANNKPELFGTAGAPDALVSVDLNGEVFTTKADANGDWVLKVDHALADGDYVPVISVSDLAGNVTETEGTPFTVDTQAPTVDTVTAELLHDDTNDTGLANDDNITNNSAPEISGTADPLAYVHVDLVDAGGAVYAGFDTQADENGDWSQALDSPLDDGTYTPMVSVIDLAGNQSAEIPGVEFTVDTTAPTGTTGVFVHNADNDTGSSSTDGITNNNSPTLEGHTEANAHVAVDVGGTLFETDADGNGYWTLTADGLDDGDYTPSIVVTDLAGNESDPVDGESFTVLTVGPDSGTAELVHDDVNDTGVDTEDNITANNKPELFGTAGAPDALVSVDLNGEVFTTKADANGDWVLKVDHALADGDYVPVISVSDLAGNVTETEGTPFTVDTQAPTADTVTAELLHDDTNDTGLANDDNITNNSAPEISGTADPLAYVHVDLVDAGGAVYAGFDTQADENGDWSQALDSPLDDGTYTPMVSVIDLAGNQSAEIPGVEFTVDTTAPTGTTGVFVHDADNDTGSSSTDGITNNNSPTLEGHAEANAHVAVDVGGTLFETDADGNGYWTLTADGLDDGDYTPSIVVTDLAGNESDPVDGESFTVLTAVPDAPDGGLTQDSINDTGVAADDGITNNNLPMLSGTAAAGGTVTVEIGDLTYTTTADELGAWTVQVTTPLADGEYTPVMTVSDLAGNVSDPFEGALIVVDTHLDPISGGLTHDDVNDTGISTDDGVTNNIAPLMSGTVEPLATVVMTLNQIRYEVQADDTGYWEIQVDTDLPDGTYIPTLEVTDLAGNTATVNGEPLTIDTMAAFADVGLPGNVMIHVGELIDFNPMANLPSGSGEIVVEDYSGTLPAGLSIDAAGHIVGLPTETGVTYITMTAIDDAGNTAQASFQVAVTALDKTANTAVNNADTATAAGYIGTDAGEHINMYSSAGDVLLAGGGNDLFQLFKPEALGFARIDGGAGVDQMKFSGVGVSMDFSAFNNIDGSGQVIEHVEEFYFAGTQSDITITAADIFALKSDIHDGNYSLIRIMSTVNNGGTVTLGDSDVVGGLTQVGAVDAFGATGGAKSGASADRYTKFTGTYTDGNGDHLVELLLQHGLTAA